MCILWTLSRWALSAAVTGFLLRAAFLLLFAVCGRLSRGMWRGSSGCLGAASVDGPRSTSTSSNSTSLSESLSLSLSSMAVCWTETGSGSGSGSGSSLVFPAILRRFIGLASPPGVGALFVVETCSRSRKASGASSSGRDRGRRREVVDFTAPRGAIACRWTAGSWDRVVMFV